MRVKVEELIEFVNLSRENPIPIDALSMSIQARGYSKQKYIIESNTFIEINERTHNTLYFHSKNVIFQHEMRKEGMEQFLRDYRITRLIE